MMWNLSHCEISEIFLYFSLNLWYLRANFTSWKWVLYSEISRCKSSFHHVKVNFTMWKWVSRCEKILRKFSDLNRASVQNLSRIWADSKPVWLSSESSLRSESEPSTLRTRARLALSDLKIALYVLQNLLRDWVRSL